MVLGYPPAIVSELALLQSRALRREPDAAVHVLTGNDRVDLMQRLASNDVKGLQPGQGRMACFVTNKGRLVDRVRFAVAPDSLLMITSPGRGAAVREWIARYVITEDVRIDELGTRVELLHLLGPHAVETAGAIDARIVALERDAHVEIALDVGVAAQAIRTEGLRAHDGVLFLVPAGGSAALRAKLRVDAADASDAEYEAARVACGLPAIGRDVGEEHNPLEAGLWDSVAFDKGCYVGQEVVARLRTYDKIMKHLVRCRLDGPAEAGVKLVSGDKDVGSLTSVAGPPLLPEWRAIGWVAKRALQAGAPIQVGAGGVALSDVCVLGKD